MKKLGLSLGLVMILGVVALRIGQKLRSSPTEENPQGQRAIPVEVISVTRETIRSTLSFSGDIKGRDQVSVFSEVPGRLLRYNVFEGDPVKRDEVIATIDRAVTGMEFEDAKVKSPISGTVGRLYLDRGDAVLIQTPLALVVRMDTVLIRIDVVERELPLIQKGLKALIQVDAYPENIFTGEVRRISPVVDPISRTAPVETSIPNEVKAGMPVLLPGMFARVILVLEEHKDVLVIPFDVVLNRGENRKIAFIVKDNVAIEKEIKMGIREGERIEILDGLEEGDSLIVSGESIVKNGDSVEVKDSF